MATAVHIPVEEYLRTSYEPDCDYVDGELQERNLGEQTHGLVQAAIAAIFRANRTGWGLRAITEQRVQVNAVRFRVPDVTIVRSSEPVFNILTEPPVLCVEILSPEDRFGRVLERVQEYTRMGVPHVWIIDPISREIWTVSGLGGPVPLEGDTLALPETPVCMTIAEIFAEIDEAPRATD